MTIPAPCLMVQGTMSSAGKSLVATVLCRLLVREGLRVLPFKAQNMSNNSWVTPDGLELGRAQATQAAACGVEPEAVMNPVLLKPEADTGSQVVLLGRPAFRASARDYYRRKPELWSVVTTALDELRARADVVVIEGAGSAAEVNLREGDIVNMRVARYADARVLLVGNIDPGGIFAQLLGTLDLLEPEERKLVRGLVVNQFRGDPALFEPGVRFLEERSGLPVLGVLPWVPRHDLPEEDALRRPGVGDPAALDVAVVRFPRISNGTDFEPLLADPRFRVRYVQRAAEVGRPDLLVLPGTKSTLADLGWLRDRGLDRVTAALAASGTPVLGICGGLQVLGDWLSDPAGAEGGGEAAGLGLLPVGTVFAAGKTTRRVTGRGAAGTWLAGTPVAGYEIHMGQTRGGVAPLVTLEDGTPDGAVAGEGLVAGTYLHGLFEADGVRDALAAWLAGRRGIDALAPGPVWQSLDARIDALADRLAPHLDVPAILGMVGAGRG